MRYKITLEWKKIIERHFLLLADYMAKMKGGIMTAHKLETKIQQLLNDGICGKMNILYTLEKM